ncbi:MAG: diguanylate cyclase [Gammaproteobacteria bacterium]|nr:diguanylate cyclase [Gammaproteobacteria bacterium]
MDELLLLAQLLAAGLTCLVLIVFVRHSRRLDVERVPGWLAISVGFSLLLFGMLIEIGFSSTGLREILPRAWSGVDDLLTRYIGQLGAVVCLAYGFARWMPAINELRETEVELRRAQHVLEKRVAERTRELEDANRKIQRESEGYARLSRKLGQSQRQMETLLGNLPGMAYRGPARPGHVLDFVSEGCIELTGLSDEELLRRPGRFGEMIDPNDRQRVDENIARALAEGERYQLEYRIHTRNGDTRHVWEQGAGSVDDKGRIAAIEGLVVDITDRKQAEQRLQLASLIIDNALEGIVVTDSDGVIESVNPSFTTITGFTAAEAVGRKPNLLKSGRHEEAFYADMWQEIRDNGSWRGEIWNRRKNGEIYPEWLTITAIRDDEGRITRMIGIFSDITQRKMTEEHLKHLAHHDVLTALPNRTLYLDRLGQQIRLAKREGKELAVLFIDLDRFKPINDRYGHNVGDGVLKEIADRLADSVRSADTVARIGGDEFTVIVGAMEHPEDAATVAEKIHEEICRPIEVQGVRHQLGASIGVSMFPLDGEDADTLTHKADVAMYSAKASGRDGIRFYDTSLES